jgi:hypothetical protein
MISGSMRAEGATLAQRLARFVFAINNIAASAHGYWRAACFCLEYQGLTALRKCCNPEAKRPAIQEGRAGAAIKSVADHSLRELCLMATQPRATFLQP